MNTVEKIEARLAQNAAKKSLDPNDVYLSHDGQPYFKHYAECVGRFQEGFLRDRVTDDLDVAFSRAVETCERLLPVIKAKAT